MSLQNFNPAVHSTIDPALAGQVSSALRRIKKALDQAAGGEAGVYAPADLKYLIQVANAALPNAQAMGALATGLVKNATGTGVLSIATAGTDYAIGLHAHSVEFQVPFFAVADAVTIL